MSVDLEAILAQIEHLVAIVRTLRVAPLDDERAMADGRDVPESDLREVRRARIGMALMSIRRVAGTAAVAYAEEEPQITPGDEP